MGMEAHRAEFEFVVRQGHLVMPVLNLSRMAAPNAAFATFERVGIRVRIG